MKKKNIKNNQYLVVVTNPHNEVKKKIRVIIETNNIIKDVTLIV